ncbi:MAG: protein-L-isoaspartate(D-aspartate) O-methyltransferase [Flavobacteriia bacterium]|nr:protein-L-isoaspartate(D-aspartate) O-methyltransferase [Flavobacteriia bacterium]
MIDTYKHKGLRKNLINELREKGITDYKILEAFDAIPRHYFLDTVFEQQAYSNIAFQIGAGQTISHPFTVAFQTSLLGIKKSDSVLEIGTGSGFQTCILCELGAKVVSIERQRELFIKAKEMLRFFKFTPRLIYGDGYKGQESLGPYDKILVTCGAPFIPEDLKKQLKIGGIMVIPVGDRDKQKMLRLTKINQNEYIEESYGDFSFVPMLERTNHIIG